MRAVFALACACASPAPADRCGALRSLQLPHVEIVAARELAAACRVDAIARPTADSEIRFEVEIPDGWNGRYRQLGNGGFGGRVPEDEIAAAAAHGDAAAGTDNGHASDRAVDASWAVGHPEKVIDFGYRAVKETHDAALAIVRAYTGRAPRYRYFAGCSDGGREGLMEAQRYPDDFDGIVAGAPANHATRLLEAFAWNALALAGPGYIPPAKLPAIEHAAIAACGNDLGVIADPPACHFDPSLLRCAGEDGDGCLTDPQVEALGKLYAGPPGYFGLMPGTEAQVASWDAWVTGSAPGEAGRAVQLRFALTYFRAMVFADPRYQLDAATLPRDAATGAAKFGPIIDAGAVDLGAFARRGGKLIVWHGWNDQVIPPGDSIAYHRDVRARMGDVSGFYRLFVVPGVMHCDGGPGPSELPTREAIEAWVEAGRAPAALVAPGWTIRPF